MTKSAFIYDQHSENAEWVQKLDFYKVQVGSLQRRLEEISEKNSASDVLAEVEHFQNQFIVQRNNIDEIRHMVNENERELVAEINSNPVAVDHRKVEYHSKEKEAVDSFEKVFNDLHDDFIRFAAKWM